MKWLRQHIQQMLSIEGFIKHILYLKQSNKKNNVYVCVHYYIKSLKHYNLYVKNYSERMRNNSNKDFDDIIQINRRVLNEIQ